MAEISGDAQAYFAMEGAAQFAVRTPAGAEAQVHLTRAALQAHPDWVTVSMDQVNAFNTVARGAFIRELASHFPGVLPFVAQFYAQPGMLVYKLDAPWPLGVPVPGRWELVGSSRMLMTLTSEEGCQQGDPLGTFLYSLVLQPVLQEAARRFPAVDLSAFADDGRVTGPWRLALACWQFLRMKLAHFGLLFKQSASLAWSPTQMPPVALAAFQEAGVTVVPHTEGVALLGTGIGTDLWMREHVRAQCDSRRADIAKIAALSGQPRDVLLRYCANTGLGFAARQCPPAASSVLREQDQAVSSVFFWGAGVQSPGPFAVHASHVPLSWGGSGMEPTELVSPRAYLAGYMAVRGMLAQLYPRFAEWGAAHHMQHPGIQEAVDSVESALSDARAFAELVANADKHSVHQVPAHLRLQTALNGVEGILAAARCFEDTANSQHAQRRLAVVFHLRSLQSALGLATPPQAAVLLGAATKGATSWMDPSSHIQCQITDRDYMLAKQMRLGLPFVGTGSTTECSLCNRALDGSPEALLQHLSHHPEMLNTHLHAVIVQEIKRMCIAQGITVRVGGEGTDHRHSTDLTVANFSGPGRHLRIDVKTGSEFLHSAIRTHGPRGFTAYKEAACVRQHAPSPVTPFVVTTMGQMGPEAIRLIRLIHDLSNGVIGGGVEPTWTQSNSERYWHRRFRAHVVAGMANIIRAIIGGDMGVQEFDLDLPENFVDQEVARLSCMLEADAGVSAARFADALARDEVADLALVPPEALEQDLEEWEVAGEHDFDHLFRPTCVVCGEERFGCIGAVSLRCTRIPVEATSHLPDCGMCHLSAEHCLGSETGRCGGMSLCCGLQQVGSQCLGCGAEVEARRAEDHV